MGATRPAWTPSNGRKRVESLGAGEILLTSMDRDGTQSGYDLELTRGIANAVGVPVIASGGVGNLEHLYEGLDYRRRRRRPGSLHLSFRRAQHCRRQIVICTGVASSCGGRIRETRIRQP